MIIIWSLKKKKRKKKKKKTNDIDSHGTKGPWSRDETSDTSSLQWRENSLKTVIPHCNLQQRY